MQTKLLNEHGGLRTFAAPETLILANGFSCREQIRQPGGREARHIAEVMAEALDPAGGWDQARFTGRLVGT